MIKSYIPNCVFEASNTAQFPFERFVRFPLPALIDGVNLSRVQSLYRMETPGTLTTDQTDHKIKGETGRWRESGECEAPKLGWGPEKEEFFVRLWDVPRWTSPPGVFQPFKTQIYSWNRLWWSAVRAHSNSSNEDVEMLWGLVPPSFMGTEVLSWKCGSMCYYALLN